MKMSNQDDAFWLQHATTYTINDIAIEKRSEHLWAVTKGGGRTVRTRPTVEHPTGVWVWESLPSERTDEFLAQTRFTLEEAKELALMIRSRDPVDPL